MSSVYYFLKFYLWIIIEIQYFEFLYKVIIKTVLMKNNISGKLAEMYLNISLQSDTFHKNKKY